MNVGDVGEKSLIDTVWDLLDAATDLDEEARYLVVAALDSAEALAAELSGDDSGHQRPNSDAPPEKPAGAYVRQIKVAGFRGIGPVATLQIAPFPGITVISGRNGSGKSSFAEALEFALTGQSYRFKNKARLWADSWRNLHTPEPCEVQVDFAVEEGPATSIGAQWAPGAALNDAQLWSQRKGEPRQAGVGALGWSTAVEIHRPILSYDEIGGLLEQEPSKLYDALARLLALDEIQDAESRLKSAHSDASQPRMTAKAALAELKKVVESSTDDRAPRLKELLRKRLPDIDAVGAITSGVGENITDTIQRLREIEAVAPPTREKAGQLGDELRDALAEERRVGDVALRAAELRTQLLRLALSYRGESESAEIACPVCAAGTLDDDWNTRTRAVLDGEDTRLREFRSASARAADAESAVRDYLAALVPVDQVAGIELQTLGAYQAAVSAALDVPHAAGDLPVHLERTLPEVAATLASLQDEVGAAIARHEDAWQPIANAAASWIALEQVAREHDPTVKRIEKARDWVKTNAQELRRQRLAPIADGARAIWAKLRQESNVDLQEIALSGTATKRRALLKGSVDGEPAGALSVMSQGELHALSLALFLPRATASTSPFRFIVLDDPIQAMDPAKIDGFLEVLNDLAQTRQVIVFSHDDRLASAIRQQPVAARLLEVARESRSTLVIREADSPAQRYTEDAYALVRDSEVPDEVKRRAVPGLFRLAIESAARQTFFTRRNIDGHPQAETEELWAAAHRVPSRVALAVSGSADTDISGWRHQRPHRKSAMLVATKGVHGSGTHLDVDAVRDLRKTVTDLLGVR